MHTLRAFVLVVALGLALGLPARVPAAERTQGRLAAFATSDAVVHGIAADTSVVFVTEPGIAPQGSPPRVVAYDRRTSRRLGELPPPPGGFRLPFALRVARPGTLAVLDNAGFPPQGPPKVHEYRYARSGVLRAAHTRTIGFDGLPLLFAEDIEVLPGGGYVVSESIAGGLWLVGRDGTVTPGLVPSGAPVPGLAGCRDTSGRFTVGGLPFASAGGFAPGVGSLALRRDQLYFGNSCLGGLRRVALATLRDTSRPAHERAVEIDLVAARRPGPGIESLKALAFDPARPRERWVYAGDPFRLRLLRIDTVTGRREVVARDPRLLNFPVAATFAPGRRDRGRSTLLVASDQEHRWVGLNGALTRSVFQAPWVVAKLVLPRSSGRPDRRRQSLAEAGL
ncbi:MAG: hypothetical protein H0U79_04540 [Solirubrobacterales bacterium]|nr:hypothetical protein [Solirubrobacterales bacterium]